MKDDRSSTAAEAGASAVPSPSSETLTERQRRVLEVIRDSVTERGYPPSIREIGGDAVGGLPPRRRSRINCERWSARASFDAIPIALVQSMFGVSTRLRPIPPSRRCRSIPASTTVPTRCQSRRSSPPSWAASLPADRSSPRKLWRMCFHSPPRARRPRFALHAQGCR